MITLPTDLFGNSTTNLPPSETPQIYGYIAIFISALFFGTNFLPVKKFKTGNGIFFQWVLCSGIWTSGLVTTAIRGFPPFLPLPMLGGFVWCTGNLMCVPAINLIGMGKGLLLWGSFNLMMGWASSRFGWFGLNPQEPKIPWMNYLGVVLCLISACMYLLTKTSGNETEDQENTLAEADQQNIMKNEVTETSIGVNDDNNNNGDNSNHESNNEILRSPINSSHQDEPEFEGRPEELPIEGRLASLERLKNRITANTVIVRGIGSFMACAAGCFFGLTFTPVIYIKDHYPHASKNGLDHVFAHYTGIYTSSTFYFLLYCAFTKNSPAIFPKVALPGFISGLMWGIACIGWFVANDVLSEAVSYPIVTTLPGIIGTLVGLMFREVKGLRNYIVLFTAISIGLAGSIVTGFSK